MTSPLRDEYQNATLVNSLPTATFASRPFHRVITNIVVNNTVPSGVTVYRGQLSSVPVAQNALGSNNTLSGRIALPAGQQLFVVWSAAGSPVSGAFARVSFVEADPLDDSGDTAQSWAQQLVTSVTLPTNATTGARIVLDGSTSLIDVFDSFNRLIAQISAVSANGQPAGFATGNDLQLGANSPSSSLQGAVLRMSPGLLLTRTFPNGPSLQTIVQSDGSTPASVSSGLSISSGIANGDSGANGATIQLIEKSSDGITTPNSQCLIFADTVGAGGIFFGGNGNTGTLATPNPFCLSWISLGLANGWTGTLKYRILASPPNDVEIKSGVMTAGTKTDGTVVATLPLGYRPTTPQDIPATTDNQAGGQSPHWHVATNGDISCFGLSLSTFNSINGFISKDF